MNSEIIAPLLTTAAASVTLATGLSVWLGGVVAKRIEQREQAAHARELAKISADHEREFEKLRDQLNLLREKSLRAHNLKIDLYRDVTEPLAKFMIDVETGQLSPDRHIEFNLQRFRSYARLAMFAPQDVIDAYDALVDFLNDHLETQDGYDWVAVRRLSQAFLNAARLDVQIGSGAIVYKGHR
jgi:uncharacterized coiled-coil protein SlyX